MCTHVGDENSSQKLVDAVRKASFIIAHNAKFELQWLARCGVDISKLLVYDTMLGEWIIAGNLPIRKDLNTTAQRYGVGEKENTVADLIKLGVDPQNIPTKWLADYCEQDVRITVGVFLKQRQKLNDRKQLHLQLSRCLLTPVLADIETNGVTLDKALVYEEYARVKQEYADTEKRLALLAEKHGSVNINWRSRKQVAEFLYDKLEFGEITGPNRKPLRTANDQRRTDKAAIESLRARTADQREFQSLYKSLAKSSAKLTKSLNFFKVVCDEYDCTFYGEFNQGRTGTHRLSSAGRKIQSKEGDTYSAQLQNLPREYKRLVRAREDGWRILEIDASQLEFRGATDLGRDEVAYKEICDGVDIHTNTAQVFLDAGTQPEFIGLSLKEARQPAKPQTFKPLYGGRGTTPAEKKYCEFFQNKYRGIFDTQTAWTLEVLSKKELRTPYGMIFYWPDTRMTAYGTVTNSTAIFNYPVQGFATAEIIPIVLVHVWHKLRDWNVRIVLTVHDSIVIEVAPDVDIDKLNKLLFECFTTDVYNFLKACYNYSMWCPLGAESKIGMHWGEGEGIKYMSYPHASR